MRRFAGVFLWVLIAPSAGARAGAFTEDDGKEWVMEAEGSGSGTEDRPTAWASLPDARGRLSALLSS